MTRSLLALPAGAVACLLVSLTILAPTDARAAAVACDLDFYLVDTTTLGSIQFNANYSATGGSIPGSGNLADCSNLIDSSLFARNDDDGTSILQAGVITLDGGIVGPVQLARCTFESETVPEIGDIVVTEIDAPPASVAGNTTSVCGAPVTGQNPPYVRDAQHILQAAVGQPSTCQLCECDVNLSGQITTSDSLTTLRAAVGTATTTCDPCIGTPATTSPAESVTVRPELNCVYPCPPVPDGNCQAGSKASISILNGDDPAKHSIKYKISGGPQTSQADLGDPTSVTSYSLCIYDQSGGVYSLEDGVTILPGAGWTDKDPRGYLYKDKLATQGGVTKVSLKPGDSGKSKFRLQAKGAITPMPVAFSGSEMFDAESVVVTLHNTSTTECWGSIFPASSSNTPAKFVAKNP